MSSTAVVARGGLGNQLFMLAAGLAFAESDGANVRLLDAWYRRGSRVPNADGHTRDFLLHRYPAIRDLVPLAGPLETYFASASVAAYTRLGRRAPWLILEDTNGRPDRGRSSVASVLYGYFQSATYFRHLRKELQVLLTPDLRDQAHVLETLEASVSDPSRAIAVHVRRGDHIAAARGGVVLEDDYLRRALGSLDAELDQVLVFSDSPDWCRSSPVFRGATVVNEPDPVRALRMMQLCSSLVMSPSSLSWWAAWLSPVANRRVVAPRPFIEPWDAKWEANVAAEWERLPAGFVPGDNPGVTR